MKILFLVAHPVEDASVRYRVHQFLPYLEREGHACTVWSFSTARLFQLLRSKTRWGAKVFETLRCSANRLFRLANLSQFDLVVIHREAFPFLTPLLEKWIMRRHPRVVFSFDDAIYAGHGDVSTLNHPLLYRLKYGRGVDAVLRDSLHVVAGNRFLADYARQFNSRVSIVPTVVDCQQYRCKPVPAGLQDKKRQPITVGWVGSRSTVAYLSAVEPALQRLAKANPGRGCFRICGCPEYRLDLDDFQSLPFRLETEVADLHAIDIGIMPLPDTAWTRGKCAFKAIQYMASGIPAVASPVGVTPEIIRDNVNGLLPNSSDDWFHALHRLVNDESLRRRLAIEARKTVEESYSLQLWGPRLASLLDTLSPLPHRHRVAGTAPRPEPAGAQRTKPSPGRARVSGITISAAPRSHPVNQTPFDSTVSSEACAALPIRSSQDYFGLYPAVAAKLPHGSIAEATDELLRAYREGRNVFLFGNGGSAALASHFACDLAKGTVVGENGHRRFRVLALTDNVPLVTAWANDSAYEKIFAEPLKNFVAAGDVAFAISASGNSPNVLRALEAARGAHASTIGLTGFAGGEMKALCEVCVVIPSDNMQIIEDFQLSVAHAIFSVIRQRLVEDFFAPPLAAGAAAG